MVDLTVGDPCVVQPAEQLPQLGHGGVTVSASAQFGEDLAPPPQDEQGIVLGASIRP